MVDFDTISASSLLLHENHQNCSIPVPVREEYQKKTGNAYAAVAAKTSNGFAAPDMSRSPIANRPTKVVIMASL